MRKRTIRLKRIKVLDETCVRFDTIPTQRSPMVNGLYIMIDGMPGIENAQEIKITVEIVK